MSNILKTFEDIDPFYQHPAAASFIEAARLNIDEYGKVKIPDEVVKDMQWSFVIPQREVSALKYLAEKRVAEELELLI